MCNHRDVLAILFRQDRLLPTPLEIVELRSQGVIRHAPQSISHVPPEVITWIGNRIGA
jgi:hypothetical protein